MIKRIKIKIKWVKSSDFLAGLALFFTSFLFFYDLFQERYLLTERDLAPYFIPPRFFWVESLKQGSFPLWNPYQFSGQPFFANPQHAVLYPLNGLFFLLPFDLAFNAVIVLHFFLGGLFTYLFLRDMKVSSTGALVSGLIFMLGGYLLSVHSLLTILLSVIWTPLIMLFASRAMRRPGIKNEILTAVFMTVSFFGGGIEIVYGNFFVLLLMALFPAGPPSPRQDPDHPRGRLYITVLKRLRSLLAVSALFLFLSAIQLLPFIELWIHSIRGTGISYQEATLWSFAPKDFLLFFLPDVYGYFLDMKHYWVTQCWLKTMYTGGLPFILCLIFFLFPHPDPLPGGEGARRNSLTGGEGSRGNPLPYGGEGRSLRLATEVRGIGRGRMLFLSLMLFSLFLSLGQFNPLYPFVYKYIPFFNGIRYPVKFLYIFILALAVTAGLGFERLAQISKQNEKKKLKHLLILLSLLSGFLLLCLVLGHREIEHFFKIREIDFPHFNHLSTNLYHTKRFFFYLTLFFLLLRIGYEAGWKGWTRVFLVSFLIADLFGNMGFYGKEKSEDYLKKTKILEIVTADKEPFRIFSTAKTIAMDTPILIGNGVPFDLIKEKHLPSLNMLFRVNDIWGIDVVRLKRGDDLYKKFTGLPSISASRLIDLYGVKHIVSVTPIEGDPRFELVYARLEGLEGKQEDLIRQNTIKLYRNKNPLPRAWLVRDFRMMDAEAILSTLTAEEFQPDKRVLLEAAPPSLTSVRVDSDLPLERLCRNSVHGSRASPRMEYGLLKINHLAVRPELVEGRMANYDTVSEGGGKSGGGVAFLSESNNRLSIRVEAETGGILVLSDTYYPGWKVFVNGREEKIIRANYNFRGVVLRAGAHQVEFDYSPFSFKLGAGITLTGILFCGIIGWIDRKKGRRKGD